MYTHVCSLVCLFVMLFFSPARVWVITHLNDKVGEMKKCSIIMLCFASLRCVLFCDVLVVCSCCSVEGTRGGVSINLPICLPIYQIVREINDFFVTWQNRPQLCKMTIPQTPIENRQGRPHCRPLTPCGSEIANFLLNSIYSCQGDQTSTTEDAFFFPNIIPMWRVEI